MTRTSAPFHPGTPWELFRFESPDMGAPAVADSPAAPAADPGVPADADPEPWEGVTREQWEETQAQQAALVQFAQQQMYAEQQRAAALAAAQQSGREPIVFDPWSEDPTGQLTAIIEQQIAQRLGPIEQTYQRIELQEGQELARDVVADNIAREGDFLSPDSQQLAVQLASGPSSPFLRDAIARYGYTDRAGEAAIEAACAHVRALEQKAGEAYYNRQTNQLATLAGARREPGSSGPAAQVASGTFRRGESIADRYFGGR